MKNGETQILIATKNRGKIKEIERLLSVLPVSLLSLNDFSAVVEAEETGTTFAENAVLKARSYALQTGLLSLADDSGLEVEALDGAPGVFSARYAGEGATDLVKIEKLLGELSVKTDENRRARFVCAMAICDAQGAVKFLTEEKCAGKIALKAAGTNGFGYDAIFVPAGFEQTFGELDDDIKHQISHRARAAGKIIQYLRDFTAVSLDL